MVAPDVQKLTAPEAQELSDAIGLVLKDHTGPVDLASVAEKLKEDHPTWKLPDRRVKKFVKKYESENKPTEGEEASKRPKMFSSPRKSLRNLFSSKSKKKVTEVDTDSDAQPAEEPVVEEPVEEEAPEDEKAAEEEAPEEIAYKTENESVESSNDCFAPCTIMWEMLNW